MTKKIDKHLSVERYASAVAALYRGPFQDPPWKDFLHDLRQLLFPCLTIIGLRLPKPGDPGIAFVGGADFSPQDHLSFANKYSALDPLLDLPDGKTVALDDIISRDALEKTDFYQAFMKPFNQSQIMGFDIHRNGKMALFLRIVRSKGDPDFSQLDRDVLEAFKPQFRELANWMESSRDYAREHQLSEQAFSSLAMGTIILDNELRIVHLNSVAEQLLENNQAIARVANRLRILSQNEHQRLQQALKGLVSESQQNIPQVISIARNANHPPLFITARRLPQRDRLDDSYHIALYMTDPELRQIDQSQLVIQAFGLTPQEARLVIALANGGTLEEFSRDTGISKNTARTHLYASFRKVGVSQQSSLVSHVIRAIYGL